MQAIHFIAFAFILLRNKRQIVNFVGNNKEC